MKVATIKKRTFHRFKTRQTALKQLNREVVQSFNRRASITGIDRKFGNWRIIDVHEMPITMNEYSEVGFWCCDGKSLYLLSIRNRPNTKTTFILCDLSTNQPNYIIVEKAIKNPLVEINDGFLENILNNLERNYA